MNLPIRALLPITAGRIFVRSNNDGVGYVGVVEIPTSIAPEHLYAMRVNDRLWLDETQREHGNDRMEFTRLGRDDLKEFDANSLLQSMKFRVGLPDYQEFFVRHSALPHQDTNKAWCFVVSASRERSRCFAQDGLFELDAKEAMKRVEVDPKLGIGSSLGQLLREPLWGPYGQFGLAHSMDPAYYQKWVEGDRQRNARQDPRFAKFMELMRDEAEPNLFYTAQAKAQRDNLAKSVIRTLMSQESEAYNATNVARPRGA